LLRRRKGKLGEIKLVRRGTAVGKGGKLSQIKEEKYVNFN